MIVCDKGDHHYMNVIDKGNIDIRFGDFHFQYFYQYDECLYGFEYSKGYTFMHSILINTETMAVEHEVFEDLLRSSNFSELDTRTKIELYGDLNIFGVPYIEGEYNNHGIQYWAFCEFYKDYVLGNEEKFINRLLVEYKL